MRLDNLYLWFLGDPERPKYVGELALLATGKGVSLRYAEDWIENGFPLSEDLPLVNTEFLPPNRFSADMPRAVGAVDDARPDRWGEKVIRFVDRPKRLSLMEYLFYAGDDRFGALGVSLSESDYEPRKGGPIPRLDKAQDLSDVVAKIAASEPLNEIESKLIAGGGSPLGGAKPKALIEIDAQQWVIKFFNHEPVDAPLVEHATMTLAKKAGIRVARTQVVRLLDGHALAILRFDRQGSKRIHSVSAGTAITAASIAGTNADLGYPALARLLRRQGDTSGDFNQQQATELFRRMVFNILIDNTDDHEKNHSLLVHEPSKRPRFELAPAYDILPTNSGQGYQEFICGAFGRDSTLDNAMSECESFGLSPVDAAQEVVKVIDVVNTWQTHFGEIGVSAKDIEMLEQTIDSEPLRSQRIKFDPNRFGAIKKKKKPKNPLA
jgi:serine/threonine-protein kinase HipA